MFDPQYLEQQLKWRYATKKFDTDRKLMQEQVDLITNAMRMAPSSFGLQPWKFVVITNPELRQEMLAVSYGQPQVVEASHLVVIAHLSDVTEVHVDRYVADAADKQDVTVEDLSGLKNAIMGALAGKTAEERSAWAARQTYIALGFGLETAALMGIDAAPMEGFDTQAVTDILDLAKDGYQAVAYMGLGYRSDQDKSVERAKVRYSAEQVIEVRG